MPAIVEPTLDRREAAEHLDLQERRRPTYVNVSQPGRRSLLLGWLAALAAALLVGAALLYSVRFEYFVMADGGYLLRMNRYTGKVCYIPADPEWERRLQGRQALLDRCDA